MTPVAGQEHNSQARTCIQASARSSSSYPPGHPTPALMARQAHTGNASTRKCPRTHADTSLERQHPAVSRTAKREPQNTTIMTVPRHAEVSIRHFVATQPPKATVQPPPDRRVARGTVDRDASTAATRIRNEGFHRFRWNPSFLINEALFQPGFDTRPSSATQPSGVGWPPTQPPGRGFPDPAHSTV